MRIEAGPADVGGWQTSERSPVVDQGAIREAVASIIQAIGEDPSREGLLDTPRRVAKMYAEFFSGLDMDPAEALATGFEEGYKEMVVLKDLPFFSICEHHLLPFFGEAEIGYVPNGRVVGASKLGRALDILARRPQLQERLTLQLADLIYGTLRPEGVTVVLKAEHMCMTLRGVKKPGSKMVTSVSRGTFRTREATRREFYDLLGDH
jgi:GTP cyclohydrolase I